MSYARPDDKEAVLLLHLITIAFALHTVMFSFRHSLPLVELLSSYFPWNLVKGTYQLRLSVKYVYSAANIQGVYL